MKNQQSNLLTEDNTIQKHKEIMERVIEYVKQGYTLKESAYFVGYSVAHLWKIKSEYAKQNGWFTKDELHEFAKQRKQREKNENQSYIAQIKDIKKLTKEGKKQEEIAVELEIPRWYLTRLIRESKDNGTWLTDDDMELVNQAREEKREKARAIRDEENQAKKQAKKQERKDNLEKKQIGYIEEIKRLTKEGKTQKEIANELGIKLSYVVNLVRKSKNDGIWLSEEELNQMSSENIYLGQIKELYKEGKTQKQIADDIGINRTTVNRLIKNSKDNGTWISEEELEEIKKRKVQEKIEEKTEKHITQIEEIKRLTKEGKTQKQISEELGFSIVHINRLIHKCKEEGIWFTDEELKEISEKTNAVRATTPEKTRFNTEKRHKKQIEDIKRLTKEGKKQKEISEELGISLAHINNLVRESKDAGTWLSEDEINEKRNQEYEDDIAIIKKLTINGKKQKQISQEIGKSVSYIVKLIHKSKEEETWLTDEELKEINERKNKEKSVTNVSNKEEIHQKQLEDIKRLTIKGKSQKEISAELGFSTSHIGRLIRKSKEQGTWLTDKEIQDVRDKKSKTNEVDEKKTTRAELMEQTRQKYKSHIEEIKSLYKEGFKYDEIAEKLNVSKAYISVLVRYSKNNGTWLTAEEIKAIKEKSDLVFQKQIEEIKRLTQEGKTQKQIAQEMGFCTSNIWALIHKSKEKGLWLTDEELQELNRKNKEVKNFRKQSKQNEIKNQKHLSRIKELYAKGKKQKQIAAEIGVSQSNLSKLINKSKKNGTWFTEEELLKMKEERKKSPKTTKAFETKKSKVYLSKVKMLYGEGKNVKQIAKEVGISTTYIYSLINESKKDGKWFTEEEVKEIKSKAKSTKEQALNNKITKDDKEIIKQMKSMIREYKTVKEICAILGFSEFKFNALRKQAVSNGIWISEEEWEAINKQKIKPKINSKRVKKQEEMGYEKFKEEIISLKRAGKKTEEIALIMECSVAHIQKIRKQCIENGTWISKEEELELKRKLRERQKQESESNPKQSNKEKKEKEKEQKRLKREEQERLKQEQALAEKLEHEEAIYINCEIIRGLERIEGKATGTHVAPFKFLRKVARQEDREEYNGEEDVSTKGRKAFIESILKLNSLGWNGYTEKDIGLITDSFYMHPELADKKILKFIVSDSAKKGGWNAALETVQELKDILGETKFADGLRSYSDWIRKQASIPKIKAMKLQGFTNTKIGEKLGMSSAEVMILLEKDRKSETIDFEIQ